MPIDVIQIYLPILLRSVVFCRWRGGLSKGIFMTVIKSGLTKMASGIAQRKALPGCFVSGVSRLMLILGSAAHTVA